jgi:vacuolar-type H+-ATPase subunit I/STV1
MKRTILYYSLAFFVALLAVAVPARAQTRDHLTAKEVELVQDAQLLDLRIGVFVRAIERRLLVVNGTAASDAKQLKKEEELWGELPKGSRADLLSDIDRIVDEAITNIDDASSHDQKNPLVAKAVRKLAAEVTRLKEQLAPLREQAKSPEELASIEHVLENGQQIIDATTKLPPPTVEPKGKKKTEKPKEKN